MQKITAGGIDLTDIIQEAAEKAELPENQLIGAAISRQLELKILLYEATDEQKAAIEAGAFEYNGNTYEVYAKPKHYDDTVKITAYDKMASASKKYRNPCVSGDYTASDIWFDIAEKMGIETDTSALGDAGSIVCKGKAKLGTHTMRDWIAWIAEAAGKNAIIINDELTLKGLANTASLTAEDATELTEANHITIDKVKKWQGDDLITAGDGDTALYLSTGNPLVEESQVTDIYGLYGGLDVYECSALKTWCSQTAGLNLGDLMEYNGKKYIITGYTRSHHGNTAEDSLELTGSTATNATKGEVTSKTKETREDGLDGSTYTPDTPSSSGSGSGSTNIKANELLTDGDPHWHIYNGENELVEGDAKRLTIGQDETKSEDGEELVEPEKVVLISYDPDTPVRVTKMDNHEKTVAKLDGDGNIYLGGNLDMMDNGGTTANFGTLRVDAIECRTLQLKSWAYTGSSKNPPTGLNVLYKGSGLTGWLKTPYGSMYFAMGILCAVDPDTKAGEMEFVEDS